ncbi:MAG: M48 family peptidase [Gammaproteobacteria bacterium]|nr:MAG: M48 family peptidase [Gammaproteobacteria bacterium]
MRYPALLLLLSLLCAFAQADTRLNLDLPDIGESSASVLSAEQDRRMGEAFMRELRQQLTILDDAEVTGYVQALGYRVASNSDGQARDYHFFVVDNPNINAFAGPGGYIGVNSGLILAAESESELAAVIAHEIAHVTQRHLARAFEAADKLSAPAAAAFIASILIGAQNSELGQAALAATQASAAQAQINFTRSNEEEADRIGIQTLARAGFDPRAMPVFFERLQQGTRYSGSNLPEFLRTHPVTTARIADTRNRAEQYPYRQVGDSLNYHLVRAKLRVLREKNPKEALKRFAAAVKQNPDRAAEHYGYAWALLRNGNLPQAREEARALLDKTPDQPAYVLLLAEIELAGQGTAQAVSLYRDALDLYPGHHALTLGYARALLQTGQAREAAALLEKHQRMRSNNDAGIYKLLAEARGAAGLTGEAHQALAEYYHLNGDTASAIEQLKIASRLKEHDFYQGSIIEARLKELEAQLALETKH